MWTIILRGFFVATGAFLFVCTSVYNLKVDDKDFDIKYEFNLFLYFYNWNRAHLKTKLINRAIFYGYEKSWNWNDCNIYSKKMHRNKLIDIPFNEDEEALLSNWIYEQNTKTDKGDVIL